MRLSIAVDDLKPCKRRLREREAEQEAHTRRANEAAVKARRKLSGVRLIIETAEDSEALFGRRRGPPPGNDEDGRPPDGPDRPPW